MEENHPVKLRILDPQTDYDLFHEAYHWRTVKRRSQPDRAPFETFIANDPRQTVIGLFNDDLLAVFLFYEYEPLRFEGHFTSRRSVSREILVEGGKLVVNTFLQSGAKDICAWITIRNTALRRYVEELGFQPKETKEFPLHLVNNERTLPTESKLFVKYAISEIPP